MFLRLPHRLPEPSKHNSLGIAAGKLGIVNGDVINRLRVHAGSTSTASHPLRRNCASAVHLRECLPADTRDGLTSHHELSAFGHDRNITAAVKFGQSGNQATLVETKERHECAECGA